MKKNLRNSSLRATVFFFMMLVIAACNRDGGVHEHDEYTCPMHPTVISDKPGACPVCGMSLVKKGVAADELIVDGTVKDVIKSPNENVIAAVATTKGVFKSVGLRVAAQGVVTYDPRNMNSIGARISGRLEKVYIKYPLQPVQKGQPVAEIYSPELVAAQKELLFLLEQDATDTMLINSAKSKLQFLGMSRNQIANLIDTKNIRRTFTLHSANSGYVIDGANTPAIDPDPKSGDVSSAMGSEMNAETNVQPSPTTPARVSELIREGAYVTKGQNLFNIIQKQSLMIELSIPAEVAKYIKSGSPVNITFSEDDTLATRIDFVEPIYQEQQKFVTARVYAPNSVQLRLGQLVQGHLGDVKIEGMWVPKTAVVNMGMDEVVFIKEKNAFIPKKITAGMFNGNEINIVEGLPSADEIAINGQYLIDSESFIKTEN